MRQIIKAMSNVCVRFCSKSDTISVLSGMTRLLFNTGNLNRPVSNMGFGTGYEATVVSGTDSDCATKFNYRNKALKAKSSDKPLPWVSVSSVNDWLLMRKLDIEPIDMVMGACVFKIDSTYKPSIAANFSASLKESFARSIDRLIHEAKSLGANAVLNIKVDIQKPTLQGDTTFESNKVTCKLFGTAVKINDPDIVGANKEPILSTLSMPDFVKLLASGYTPLGLSLGVSAGYVTKGLVNNVLFNSNALKNTEVQTYTYCVYDNKRKALHYLSDGAKKIKGSGVICEYMDKFVHEIESGGNNDRVIGYISSLLILGTVISENTKVNKLKPEIKLALHMN
jgi:uncharacterized protein YbjQ (UPF0145 family)